MEDILIALIQGFFELLGALCEVDELVKFVLKAICHVAEEVSADWPGMGQGPRAGWIGMLYLIFGLIAGTASIHCCHDVFFRRSATRLTLLLLGPLFTGILSWIAAHLRLALGQILVPRYYFWWAFIFSVGLCVVRFGFCHRPEM